MAGSADAGGASLRVGVLAYPGCLGTEIFGITDVLLIANRIGAAVGRRDPPPRFEVEVVARRAGAVVTAGGVTLHARRWHRRFDSFVVPGFELRNPLLVGDELQRWQPEIRFVRSLAAAGVPVASVCVGAFLLGEAGLLDGRRATTSWLFARALQERYPDATVAADLMVASDGDVTTTAAFNAVHDLALRIVRAHAGDNLMRHVARLLLIADNRNSQAPYVDDVLLATSSGAFARAVKRWLVEHLADPYDLPTLARTFHVSTRTMLRRFGEEAGESPLDFLQQARVDTAKRLLESPDHTVASAMQEVGYTDPGSFRRLFTERVGLTPAAYRRTFVAGSAAPTSGSAPRA